MIFNFVWFFLDDTDHVEEERKELIKEEKRRKREELKKQKEKEENKDQGFGKRYIVIFHFVYLPLFKEQA